MGEQVHLILSNLVKSSSLIQLFTAKIIVTESDSDEE